MSVRNHMVLVAGGAGYIGSRTVVQLVKADYRVVFLDSFHNSRGEVVNRHETIAGSYRSSGYR